MRDLDSYTTDELVAFSHELEGAQRYGDLEDILRRIIRLSPTGVDHLMRLGWTLLALDRPAEARDVFFKISGPGSPHRAQAAWGEGIAAHRTGDATSAMRLLSFAVKGGIAAAKLPLVKAANDGGEFRKALEVTAQMVAQAPLDREAVSLHARQLAYVGDFRRAAGVILEFFSKKTANSELLELLSQTLTAAKNYAGASNALSQLLRIDFERVEMQALWTYCLAEGYTIEQAEEMLGRLVSADPVHCAALYQLALLAERRSDLEKAAALAARCAEIQPASLIVAGLRGRLELLTGAEHAAAERLKGLWRSVAKIVEAREKPRAPLSAPPQSGDVLTPTIYIPVEISSRELLSRLLIALFAVRAGFNVIVLGHTVLRQATHLPRGIVLNKTLHAMDDVLVNEARARGHVFCAIDEEAFGWTNGINSLLRTLDLNLLPSCAALFAPGQYYVREVGAVAPGADLVLAGNPRTDFFDPRLSQQFADEARILREREGRSIVLCTNFGGWNSRSHLHETVCSIVLRASGTALNSPRGRWLQEVYEDSAAAECRNTVAVREALPALARAFPGYRIILRPHPGENAQAWQRMLAGVEGVTVSSATPLHVQMLASDLLIHLAGCGTGLEARLAGRPTVCLNPVAAFAYPRLGISTALSPNARDTDELLSLVKAGLDAPPVDLSPAQQDLISLHVERPPNLTSTVIADHIAALFKRITGVAPGESRGVQPSIQELRSRLSAAKAKADAMAFGNIGLQSKRLTVGADEITATLAKFAACLGLDGKPVVTPLADGVFSIRVS